MKKKISFGLSLAMVLSLAACGNNAATTTTSAPAAETTTTAAPAAETTTTTTTVAADTEAAETTAAPVEAEPISTDPIVYLSFENTDGLTSVERNEDNSGLTDTSAKGNIVPSSHDILIAEGQGAIGNALYLDGKYGVDFELNDIPGDAYTFSFWFNADRVATYGPVVQVGRNIATSDDDNPCTWLNFTKSTWGANDADIFPVAWNRNSQYDVWPWIYAMDDQEHGKREWCMVTITSNGVRYVADDGLERVETKFYLDGELKWEANSENMYYQGLSPEILTGSGVEAHIGINYWDTIYKGFIDELCVFDYALTDGQVKTLFENGNPPEKPVAPEYDAGEAAETEEAAPVALAAAPVDASAIAVLGTPDRTMGFWTDHTDGYELKDGATLTFTLNNYSDGVNNYDNMVTAFTNTAVKADTIPSADNYEGYAEYAVIRADAYGWGHPDGAVTYGCSWGDDWAGWLKLMTGAKVVMNIQRDGTDAFVDYTFTGEDGTAMTETAVLKGVWAAEDPVYVHILGEAAYIEL
ncbi:MAG: hypothetical protein IJT87_12615, partial [Ruminiclostridium sp.]|nr:hypothetical protein [Ruminiclostridium sp.]